MPALIPQLKRSIKDLYSLLYPAFCPGCNDALETNEQVICTTCRVELPRTNFLPATGNQIEKHFWGRVKIEQALAYLQFHKDGSTMHLLHQLKYKGKQEVGEVLGRMFASESIHTGFFSSIEVIVPVPLHISKKRKRGYNQCDSICRGISEITDVPSSFGALRRTTSNTTQTNKSRFGRYENTKGLFVLKEKELAGKHVLLVDDVVTTGSTMEACIHPLISAGCLVSVLALAAPVD